MNNRIEVIVEDITRVVVDALVNAANSTLMGGGGVDGAIHRAGGPEILEACRRIVENQGSCATGEAVITTAGRLQARYVIHTVGPVWQGGKKGEDELLSRCYLRSLELASEHQCRSIAFPNISTGVYRFPKQRAASIAIRSIRSFLERHELPDKVILVCFDTESREHLLAALSSGT